MARYRFGLWPSSSAWVSLQRNDWIIGAMYYAWRNASSVSGDCTLAEILPEIGSQAFEEQTSRSGVRMAALRPLLQRGSLVSGTPQGEAEA